MDFQIFNFHKNTFVSSPDPIQAWHIIGLIKNELDTMPVTNDPYDFLLNRKKSRLSYHLFRLHLYRTISNYDFYFRLIIVQQITFSL